MKTGDLIKFRYPENDLVGIYSLIYPKLEQMTKMTGVFIKNREHKSVLVYFDSKLEEFHEEDFRLL